ncbi:hypothetical protein SAMN05192561_10567 [Halopenitus malekzadehii]|uniref:Tyrosyl-DNA phosphodiesterase n=1 Tax=Halopenitus malekzadehii TaxID=1267564 RepID=A0A1H6J407_9EURY|nr:tyrosyl-DNA phosphodiesterase [Halopenitus malekzadehii]SEH53555.1 hypothetical protein SAMN05192561_10567 [Halopenitus malekzadehii]
MAEQFDLRLGGRAETAGHVELFRSYGRFETYFEDAVRMRVVTYCDSPEFILELFDRVESLEQLEVVVGDVADYRERLIDKPELADRLEHLKRDDKLVIYLCETKEVHSKLYLIEYSAESDDSDRSGETDASQQTFEWTDSDSTASSGGTDTGESEDTAGTETVRPATAIVGSPNLSSNAWTRQANTGVVFETETDTSLWGDFVDFYEEHRSYNNDGPFLDDLTERLERTSDDRAEVVSLYTEGKVKTRDEVSELHGRLDERIESEVDEVDLVLGDETELSEGTEEQVDEQHHESDDSDGESETSAEELDPSDESETRINLSLLGHSDDAIEALARMTDYDASLSGDSLTTTPQAVQQYKRDVYEVPTMRVYRTQTGDDAPVEFGRALRFHTDGRVYRVGQPLPDDPGTVDTALSDLEGYFETVDKYGNCNDEDAVKAHMAEALLWMFWAPFANRDAAFYDQYGIDLDKALPNLYIYGESDAGKGTFAQFVLSMISGGRVVNPVDADEVGKRKVRGMRSANTAFPVVVDDITKDTVNRLDTFRNYWGNWTPDASFPLFAFISNDKRPDEWFRNRSKILHFNVNFDTSYKGEAEVNRLIEQDNPLFLWFTHEMLTRELTLSNDDDALRTARAVMLEFYEYADRDVPEWFPRRPAEQEHDAGRDRWFDLLAREDITTEDQGDRLRVSFPEEMSTDTYTYARDPPTVARVERRGRDLLIKSPDEFLDWLGEPPAGVELDGRVSEETATETSKSESAGGVLGRVRGLFS